MDTSDAADILYVEDNLDHAELVLRCLERRGVRDRVIHVQDGEKALALLEEVKAHAHARPRFVLLDLRLPRVAGMEVLRQVKSSPDLRDIPVIVFTTSASPGDMRDAYANYVNSYLVKPDDMTTLNGLMTDLSVYWLDRNQTLASEHSA